jgi:osmotically-inducible protein OsmY
LKTDEHIHRDIKAELQWESRLRGSAIEVRVHNGYVTLTGSTDSYPKRTYAEKAARRVSGVTGVANELEVKITVGNRRDDTDIKQAVENAITWNSAIDENRIKVTVDNGWVTLEGNVSWDYQRTKARLLAEDTVGVAGVTNLVRVQANAPTPAEVLKSISEAFKRNFYLNPDHIKVEVDGTRAILTGEVRTVLEKEAAENAAWSAPGITEVENRLQINLGNAFAA